MVYAIDEKWMALYAESHRPASSQGVISQTQLNAASPVPVLTCHHKTSADHSNQIAHSRVGHRPIAEKQTSQMWRAGTPSHGGHGTGYPQDKQRHHWVCLGGQ